MNVLVALAALMVIFVVLALYYALRYPNGKWFPSRRDKLLRKVGPLVAGKLEGVSVRFFTRAGGVPRVTLAATYGYQVRGTRFSLSLPTDSAKLSGPSIRAAETVRERITDSEEREFPQSLTLDDGTVLDGRERIQEHFFERLRLDRPEVQVLFDKGNPALSTVRDWR
jgi:hypothetical protein